MSRQLKLPLIQAGWKTDYSGKLAWILGVPEFHVQTELPLIQAGFQLITTENLRGFYEFLLLG